MGLKSKKKTPGIFSLLASGAFCIFMGTSHAGIIQINPSNLSGTEIVDFEDLGLTDYQQVTYDTVFESGFTQFGERFVGQTVTANGNFDVLTGTPSGNLTLAVGLASQNVSAADGGAGDVGNTGIAGSGPLGYPDFDANGEGSIAILFDFDQSEFGMDILGSNFGTATLQFWERDGSLIDEILLHLDESVSYSYGFSTDDNSFSIAGVSIFNNDSGGIGFDNFRFDVAGVPGDPSISVPEPSIVLLIGTGLVGLGFARRRKFKI